ncbi:MAG: LysM peptidoglycan-binding domain-containing protein [Marinilabiliaceae bacterium]|nr:LysM peptidoglycan-binding domain-containing protein [Marinilabiliaceae bacterium]
MELTKIFVVKRKICNFAFENGFEKSFATYALCMVAYPSKLYKIITMIIRGYILTNIIWMCFFMLISIDIHSQEIVRGENGQVYKLYTIKKSEGLYRISINNNTTQEEILAANPQLRETGIVEGTVIRIPLKESDLSNSSTPIPNNTIYSTHVVAKGETAYGISQQYGMKLTDFYALNPQCVSGITEGIAVKVTVKAETQSGYLIHNIVLGETFYSISRKYGVTVPELLSANTSLDISTLPVGTSIRVPISNLPTEDQYFYYHRISKGETLYALTLRYDVPLTEIQELNPDTDWSTLSVGQIVAIRKPYKKEADILYTVKKKDTLFSISQKFNMSYEQLKAANKDLDLDNLKRDMEIRIPQIDFEAANAKPITLDDLMTSGGAVSVADLTDTYDYKQLGRPTINIALMLPFDADTEMRQMNATGANTELGTYHFRSRRYIEFYEGIKLALDTLSQVGVNTRLQVVDVNNRLDAQNYLAKAKESDAPIDLIIGPAHSDEIHDVALFSQSSKTPVVLPFSQCDSLLRDIPYIYQASIVDTVTTPAIMTKMVDYCEGKNVIILASINKGKADLNRLHLAQKLCSERGITPILHNFDTKAPETFLECLSTDKNNVILLTTTNEAKAGSILTAITTVMDMKQEAQLQLLCTAEWLTYQSVEVEVYHKLNTIAYSTFALDYNNPRVLNVMEKYRNEYFAEPVAFAPYFQKLRQLSGFSEFALWGYDIAMKFVGARVQYGPNFYRRINDFKTDLTQSNFIFKNITNWGGAVNMGIRSVRFAPNGDVIVSDLE